jgi:hypothetical protein
MRFLGGKGQKIKNNSKKQRQYFSRCGFAFTPAFGRAVAPFGAAILRHA